MSRLTQPDNTMLLLKVQSQTRIKYIEHKKRKASNSFDQSSSKIETIDQINARERQQRGLTIARLQEKIKKLTNQCQHFQSKSNELQLSLNFYKVKLQQECQRTIYFEQGIDSITASINAQVNIIRKFFQDNTPTFPQQKSKQQQNSDPILKAMNIIKQLQNHLEKIQVLMFQKKKIEAVDVQKMYKSMNATLELTKTKYQREKKLLKKEIYELTTKYEEKVAEGQDYKTEISNLLKQRTYTNELLTYSQKQRISLANDIYHVAKTELDNKLENMTKSELIFLCLQLYSKIKDLEADRKEHQKKIAQLETEAQFKYHMLLRQVKSIEKSPKSTPNRLKKMKSMPAE